MSSSSTNLSQRQGVRTPSGVGEAVAIRFDRAGNLDVVRYARHDAGWAGPGIGTGLGRSRTSAISATEPGSLSEIVALSPGWGSDGQSAGFARLAA